MILIDLRVEIIASDAKPDFYRLFADIQSVRITLVESAVVCLRCRRGRWIWCRIRSSRRCRRRSWIRCRCCRRRRAWCRRWCCRRRRIGVGVGVVVVSSLTSKFEPVAVSEFKSKPPESDEPIRICDFGFGCGRSRAENIASDRRVYFIQTEFDRDRIAD